MSGRLLNTPVITPMTLYSNTRSSHRRCSIKKGAVKIFAKLPGKHLYECLFFNKFTDLTPATCQKKKLRHRYISL